MRLSTFLVICLILTTLNQLSYSQVNQFSDFTISTSITGTIKHLYTKKVGDTTYGYFSDETLKAYKIDISDYFDKFKNPDDGDPANPTQCTSLPSEEDQLILFTVPRYQADGELIEVYYIGNKFYKLTIDGDGNCQFSYVTDGGEDFNFQGRSFSAGHITASGKMTLLSPNLDSGEMEIFLINDISAFESAADNTAREGLILNTGEVINSLDSPLVQDIEYEEDEITTKATLIFGGDGTIYTYDPDAAEKLSEFYSLVRFKYDCATYNPVNELIYFIGQKDCTNDLLEDDVPENCNDEFSLHLASVDFKTKEITYTQVGDINDWFLCSGISGDWIGGQLIVNSKDMMDLSSLRRYNALKLDFLEPNVQYKYELIGGSGPVYMEVIGEESVYGNRMALSFVGHDTVYTMSLLSGCLRECGEHEEPDRFGLCVEGKCECEGDKYGETCYEIPCPGEDGGCGEFGICNNQIGVCECDSTHTGEVCSERRCPNDCNGENGECDTTSYACQCTNIWGGEDCSIRAYEMCSNFTKEEFCTEKYGCGWCRDTSICERGDGNGPVIGACKSWQYGQKFQVGLLIIAIIMIAVFILMFLNNIISAISVDYRTAGVIEDNENLLTTSFLKEAYWRDERSSKSWTLFEQFQFFSFYALFNVTFTSRIIQFTSYFNWANFNLPLPFYDNKNEYSYRDPSRTVLNADQYANSLGLDRQQIYYSVMFWFLIAIVIFLALYGLYALIIYLALRSRQEKIGRVLFQKLFYVLSRLIIAAQLPIAMVSAYHIRAGHSSNKGTIAAAVVTLIVFGILPILFNAFVVRKQDKNLLYLYLKLRYGAFYSVYHYKKARFGVIVMVKRLLIGIFVGFLIASVQDQDKFIVPQAIIIILIHVIYIALLVIFRPYLDSFHFLLDIVLALLNSIIVGVAIMHKNSPSSAGEIIAACCVLLAFFVCVIAYIHSWTRIKGRATYICCMFKNLPTDNPGQAELETKKDKNTIESDADKSSSEIDSSIISDSEEADESEDNNSESEENQKDEESNESEENNSESEDNKEDEESKEEENDDDEISADSVEDSSDDEESE